MAHLHGLAGKWTMEQANLRSRRIAHVVGCLCMPAMMLSGFLSGYAWGSARAYLGAAAMCVVGLVFLRAIKLRDPLIRALSKQRLQMLLGARGELVVGTVLLQKLDAEWHLFNGVQLESNSDIDHIVVGPGGVFCISTKSTRGWFVGTDVGLLHNNQPCRFTNGVWRQAMGLKERLTALMGSDAPYVQCVIALPFGYTQGDVWHRKVWLCSMRDLAPRILKSSPKRLNKEQVERVAKVMEMIKASAAAVYERAA